MPEVVAHLTSAYELASVDWFQVSAALVAGIRRLLSDPSRRHISEIRSSIEKMAREKFCSPMKRCQTMLSLETYPRDSPILSKL